LASAFKFSYLLNSGHARILHLTASSEIMFSLGLCTGSVDIPAYPADLNKNIDRLCRLSLSLSSWLM
jgi:hypothetical protein